MLATTRMQKLEIKRDGLIRDIKIQIQEKLGILTKDQKLIFQDKELNDNLTPMNYRVFGGAILRLVVTGSRRVWVDMREFNGKKIKLETKYHDTIGTIKIEIQLLEGIPVEDQILLLNEQQLDDNKTLMDYTTEKEVTLNFLTKRREAEQ